MLAQFTIPHTHEGFLRLEETRRRLGLTTSGCAVALETAHNLLIDFLWARGYSQVYVVPPKMVKSNRSRYRQSGAHTDQSDSFVLADLLRTDCGVLQPWHPDSLLTRQMRAKVNLISFLTRQILRLHNRLTAVLLRYYPAALQIFSCLSQIGTDFIQAYPTPQAARRSDVRTVCGFCPAAQVPAPPETARVLRQPASQLPRSHAGDGAGLPG